VGWWAWETESLKNPITIPNSIVRETLIVGAVLEKQMEDLIAAFPNEFFLDIN
jgi:hypothetical protein